MAPRSPDRPNPPRTMPLMGKRMLTLALAAVAGFLGALHVRGTQGSETLYARKLEICASADELNLSACVDAAVHETELSGERMVQITRDTFVHTNAARCHQALHSLGRTLSARLQNSPKLPRESWESCGYGLPHGTYENLDNTALNTGTPTDTCNRPEFAGTEGTDLRENCVQAIGHSAWKAHDSDIERALAVCARSRARSDLLSCSSGVYMSYYDSSLPADLVTGAADVAALLGGCSRHPRDLAAVCASFYEISIRSETLPEHLEICLSVSAGDHLCHYKLGLHGALGVLSGQVRSEDVSAACSQEGERAVERCWAGAYEGSANHGLGDTERQQLACNLFWRQQRCDP